MDISQFRSLKTLGRITQILLAAGIVVSAFTFAVYAVEKAFYPGVLNSDAELDGGSLLLALAFLLVGSVSLIIYLTTVVTFLMWIHRGYKNLIAFGVESLSYSPGWAVGYWFIPILCLFYPLKIVNELHHGSNPDNAQDIFKMANDSSPPAHLVWWILWVFLNIVANITVRISLQSEDPDLVALADSVDMILTPLWMVCGWLAFKIVGEITERQETFGSRLQYETPPAPPEFG